MGISADFNDGLVLLIVKVAFEYWQWINKNVRFQTKTVTNASLMFILRIDILKCRLVESITRVHGRVLMRP